MAAAEVTPDTVAAPAEAPRERVIERVAAPSDWKLALIRLVEALVWPVAFVAVALIFRVPLTDFITALAKSLGH